MLSYGRQTISAADIETVVHTLRSPLLTTGPAVGQFETAFAAAVGAKCAVAVCNGTAALHAAVVGAGIAEGDEVIVPALTFAASANCVRYVGGTVVFADIEHDTMTLDGASLERLITAKTRAIIAVDYAGQPADYQVITDCATRHGLTVIADGCHSLGASYRDIPVGRITNLTAFSFHPVKPITTGEGGMVTTDDPDIARRIREFRNHGITTTVVDRERSNTWWYEMASLGYNYRLTDLQSALGLSQLARLPQFMHARRQIASRYTDAFADLPQLELPVVRDDRTSGWHLYVIRVRPDRLTCGRTEVFAALRAENIGVAVHYIPVPWHPYYASLGFQKGAWPETESSYERMVSLPIFPAMTDADIQDVVDAVRKVIRHFAK